MSTDISTLFRRFQLRRLVLPSRIVASGMVGPLIRRKGLASDVAASFRDQIELGVGLILATGVMPDDPSPHDAASGPSFEGLDSLQVWAKVISEVHSAGGRIARQLDHHWLELSKETDWRSMDMTGASVADIVEAFASAAEHARMIGFDAVEFSCPNSVGAAIDPSSREALESGHDKLSGARGARLTVEVVRAIREAIGDEFPLILRFSQWMDEDQCALETPEDLGRMLASLSEASIDIFHASTWDSGLPAYANADLNLAGWTRKLTGKPTISADGMLSDPPIAPSAMLDRALNEMVRRLAAGEFDLLDIGNLLLTDPELIERLRGGELS